MEVKLLGTDTKEGFEKQIKIVAAAGKLSRFKGNVFEILEKCNSPIVNLKFIKRVLEMNHTSIADHDYFVFAIADVTPIVEQTIIGSRFSSFTIKSRREVDFRDAGYYVPLFRDKEGNIHKNNNELQDTYIHHMNSIFKDYGYFVDNKVPLEDARFLLPYCYHSNIIMGMDATELSRQLKKLLSSEITELKQFGEALLKQIEERAPYMLELINNKKGNKEFFDFNKYREDNNLNIEILPKPKIVNYTCNFDDTILTSYIMGEYQCDERKAKQIIGDLNKDDPKFKVKLMRYLLNEEDAPELKQASFQIQIPISLAVLTELTRHRTHSIIVPEFAPIWNLDNYIMPETINNFDPDKYVEIHEKNKRMCEHFKSKGVKEEDLIYFYLSSQMCNVLTTMDAFTLAWISKRRCCNKAQWQIRDIFYDIVKDAKKIAPIYGKFLGPACIVDGTCPEKEESCKKKLLLP